MQRSATIVEVATPPMRSEGGGIIIIRDCLANFADVDIDPFLMLHEAGPMDVKTPPMFGMHPHRGFCEVPYMKRGKLSLKDHWGGVSDLQEGGLQWGHIASGIEHGGSKTEFSGTMHVFQMWVNLPSAHKMTAAAFQDVRPESLPVVNLGAGARAKVLVGELAGVASPVKTLVSVRYLDVEVDAASSLTLPLPAELTTRILMVYHGAGVLGDSTQGDTEAPVSEGKCYRLDGEADCLRLRGAGAQSVGALLLTGVPIREAIVKHGPFVMNTQAEIRQAFQDHQNGRLCGPDIRYDQL